MGDRFYIEANGRKPRTKFHKSLITYRAILDTYVVGCRVSCGNGNMSTLYFLYPLQVFIGRGLISPGFFYLRLPEPSDQAERTNHEIKEDKMGQKRNVHI